MADSTWYRGTATGVAPAPPGTVYHDFGEGVYLTDRYDVALQYAELRADGVNPKALVFEVKVDLSRLNVWDLRTDQQYQKFLREGGATVTNEDAMKMSTKAYSTMFQNFIRDNKLQAKLQTTDVIIGPEYFRGGVQLCILHKNGQPSQVARNILPQFRLIWQGGKKIEPIAAPQYARRDSVGPGSGAVPIRVPVANSPLRQALGNQAALAALGQGLIDMNMRNMDANVFKAAERDLNGRLAKEIQAMLSRGNGVLAIICAMQTTWRDGAGQQFRSYHATYLQSGPDPDTAAAKFHNTPAVAARQEGQERVYYYRWYPPHPVY